MRTETVSEIFDIKKVDVLINHKPGILQCFYRLLKGFHNFKNLMQCCKGPLFLKAILYVLYRYH